MSNLQRGHLCYTCNAIFAANEPPFSIFWSTKHHGSIKSLKAAAKARCYICFRLWEYFKIIDETLELPEYQVWPRCEPSFRVLFKLGKREYGFSFIDETGKLEKSSVRSRLIDSIEANNAGMRTCLSSSLRSEQSMHQARSWIQDCDEHHTGCHKQRSSNARLPTRLVRVQRVDRELNVHLCEGDSLPATGTPYLTLSHCWGQIKFMTLIEKSLPDFQKRIPIEELSNTFQDALYVVVELGFEYIWIDSLCIIQDSHRNEDWEREAKMMSDIYKNAAFNLAVEPSPSPSSTPTNVGSLTLAQIRDDSTLKFPNPILREIWDQMAYQNPEPIPHSTLYAGKWVLRVHPITQLMRPITRLLHPITQLLHPITQLLYSIIRLLHLIGHLRRTRLWKAVRGFRSRSYTNATEVARVFSVEHEQAQSTPPGFLVERQQADLVPPSIYVNWKEGKGQLQLYKGRQFVVSESDPFQETWSGTLSTRGWVLQEQILVCLNMTLFMQ